MQSLGETNNWKIIQRCLNARIMGFWMFPQALMRSFTEESLNIFYCEDRQ